VESRNQEDVFHNLSIELKFRYICYMMHVFMIHDGARNAKHTMQTLAADVHDG
jgi:hypothetical protein